jgi:acyl-CoA thioester hydrolase
MAQDQMDVSKRAAFQAWLEARLKREKGWRQFRTSTEPPNVRDYPLYSTEKLRFSDTDRHGHISNAVFAVCCQNARMELLADPDRAPIPNETQFVIVRFSIDFLAEMHWPGQVEIGTGLTCFRRSSLVLGQGLFVRGVLAARAASTVVLMDRTTRRAIPLPDPLLDALVEVGQYGWHNRRSRSYRLRNALNSLVVRR